MANAPSAGLPRHPQERGGELAGVESDESVDLSRASGEADVGRARD
jgi:hypothetical protein